VNKFLSTDYLFERRIEHQNKISEAIDNHDEKWLSILESKWVHRYGLDSLPAIQHNFFQLDKSQCVETLDVQENINKECSQKEEEMTIPTVSNVDDEKLNNEVSKEVEKSVLAYSASITTNTPAPPSPSIRHLRRWMPLTKDGFPRAS